MRATIDGKAVALLQSHGIAHPTKSKVEFGCMGEDVFFDDVKICNAEPAGKQFAPLSLKRSAGSSGCGFSRIFGALRLKPQPLLPLAQLPCPAFLLLVSLMRLIMNPNHALA